MIDPMAHNLGRELGDELSAALDRVRHCLSQLSDEQVWQRAAEGLNSVGNLLLHLAGNVRQPGGFAAVWRHSELFAELRRPQSAGACASCGHYDSCRGGCMAAKFFTGLPLDGPDPECVLGHGEHALAGRGETAPPKPSLDHSRRARPVPVPVTMGSRPPARPCDESPLAASDRGA